MKFVAISTVRDEGAAEVAKEALESAGIDVEVKRISPTAYVGPLALIEFEVRVPEDRVADAEQVLEQLSEDAEAAAGREWQLHAAELESAAHPTSSSKRPFKIWPTWAIVVLILASIAIVGLVALPTKPSKSFVIIPFE
jgi:hypothetical protein